ncbi:MAG: NADH-quinone oxidoreductase subunit NuoG [Actinomycetia bacterium]|nr:NADH-quinone oxidoreductase subunit NuoG [Actinomycetes bacterium]MCP4226871.1 NADH-quinone oxidoreductase subunit NuoG [Actinomycetes bacterium]MCP5032870.1 NADH-quinone oxidoreductase subunit NuoG [Actinomycetes bacterium]
MSDETNETLVSITVNGQTVECEPGEMVIAAAERSGTHIPRFCYHDRMKPVGMCRMCLVEIDAGRGPGLQPSCMIPVADGMVVDTESDRAKRAQEGVLELLLINHPLDCPVCDKGGECPLQDNAYGFGPGESRFVEEKRHYEKPIPISDLVYLDRERCILCDRCTRFASEVAGDPLIHFIDRGNATHVNTFPDHPFSSYFSGNTVQICPVGALTATPYRFKARPWDLNAVESTATVDATGARVVVQASQNELVRVLGVDSDAVNRGWLSDKERFSYEAAASPDRVTQPYLRHDGDELVPSRWSDATKVVARALRGEPEKIAVLGGARLNLEDQYAWAKLMKGVIGTDHFDCQLGDGIPAPMALGLARATIDRACAPGGVVVLLGPDLKEEQPTLFLRLRHAVINDGVDLIEMTPRKTGLSELATVSIHARPGSVGHVARAMADGDTSSDGIAPGALARARALLTSDRQVTVVLGRGNLAETARYTADAVGAMLKMAPEVRFLPALRRGNVFGALEMGLTPGFLPGGIRRSGAELETWPFVPDFDGRDADGLLRAAADGEIETLVLLGADPLEDFPDRNLVDLALEQVTTVIALDAFVTSSVARADVILPVALFGEADGTFLNLEGRLSPVRAKVTPAGQAKADWMIAVEVASALGFDLGFVTIDELRAELGATASSLAEINWATIDGVDEGPLIKRDRHWVLEFGEAADQLDLGDGLLLVVDHKLWDEGTMIAQSKSLAGLPEPAVLRLAAADATRLGLGSSGTVKVDGSSGELEVGFIVDPAVTVGTACISIRLPGFDARDLLVAGEPVTRLSLEPGEES